MAAALGLGTNQVPASVYSEYAKTQGFRETRAAQVAKGAKGTDVSYPMGVGSPVYSENVSTAMTKGGSVFIGGVGAYEFKAPPAPTEQLQAPSTSNPLFTVGAPQYQPSPMLPKQSIVDVQVPTPFGFMGGIPDVSGRGKPVTMRETGIVVGETTSTPFGIRQPVHGGYQPTEVKQTLLMKDMGTATVEKTRTEAWQNYAKDATMKQEKEIQEVVQSAKSQGYIVSPYKWTDEKTGETFTKFGNPVRDYSLLPATPSERTQRLLTPFEEAGAKANTGDIMGGLFPAARFVNLGLPEGKKLEYKSPVFKVAIDLGLSMVGIAGKEGAKLTAGSYYRLAPVEFQTEKQLQEFKASPQKQAEYKQLAAGQLEGGRQESAVNIATVGAFEIAGAAAPLVRGSSVLKNVPFIGKAYVPEKAGISYVSSLAKGEAREGVFNPRFITQDSVVQYIPDKPGVFNRVGSNIITENPASMTTRVVSSKAIEKLPAAIGTSQGIFTDITEGAAVKLKRTTTVYSTEGTSIGSFTTGYSVKGEIYGQKGTLTAGMGDLATIEQNMIFIPKRGEAEFYKFTNTGTAATSMSIPIEGFGVGRIRTSAFLGKQSEYSTMNVLGRDVSQTGVVATYNPRTRFFEVSDYARVKIKNIEGTTATEQHRNAIDILQEASRYRSIKASKVTITVGQPPGRNLGVYGTERKITILGEKATMKGTLKHELAHDVWELEQRKFYMDTPIKIAKAEFKAGTKLPWGYSKESIYSKANELFAFSVEGVIKPKTEEMQLVTNIIKQQRFGDANLNVLSFRQSTRPIMESGYKTFGTIKTSEGKPVAMVEYFSKTEPQTVELLPEPRAYRTGGRRGGMKPLTTQVQVQEVPTALKYAPTTKASPSVQIQKTATQTSPIIGFSVADYDKPMQVEATSSKSIFKVGSLGGQMPSMKINRPTGLKEYFQPATTSKSPQSPEQKFYQPTDTGLKGYVGDGLKVYTPQETPQKTYRLTEQKVYQAQPQTTTPNIPFIGTPNVKVPYQPPKQPPFVPPSFIGGDMSGGFEFGKKTKREKGKYSPSFIAVTLGIRGKPGKSEMTGFAIRPMALAGKKKKR